MVSYSVYVLLDPRETSRRHAVRYVGSTSNPKARLRQHIALARKGTKSSRGVGEWIRELDRDGLAPVMEVVDRSPARGGGRILENHWVKRLRGEGVKLLNVNAP